MSETNSASSIISKVRGFANMLRDDGVGAAYDFIVNNYDLDREQKESQKNKTFYGNEIVANTGRPALMNLFLHNIGEIDGESLISPSDALIADEGKRFDYVLANEILEDLESGLESFWEIVSIVEE